MIEKPKEEDAFARVQLARHHKRPYLLDLVPYLFEDYTELCGDRRFSDDPALVCGVGLFNQVPVAIIGQQKGRDTNQRRRRNFGMAKPEGYRKAMRTMEMAEKFGRPILTFIDTPGAYPGIDAEERGQAEAIARNLFLMSRITVPIIVVIIGEGGSGGALAIGVGDYLLMLENAVYSVISPEGCAAILWKDSSQSKRAAECLRLTASELYQQGVIDEVIREPQCGAHEDLEETARLMALSINVGINRMFELTSEERLARRYKKLRALGS